MALRDCINNDEIKRLQQAHLENDGDWNKTRKALPGVDPVALDRGFREFITEGKTPSKRKPSKGLTKAELEELARLEAAEAKAKDPLK